MNQQAIARLIQQHVETRHRFRFAELGYQGDTDLLECRAVDSFGMIELVTWLEESFAITLSEEELNSQELATVDGMAAAVLRHGGRLPVGHGG